MSEQIVPTESTGDDAGRRLRRRGLVAGAAALVAALLGKSTERVAEAAHGAGTDAEAIHRNQANTSSTTTSLTASGGIGFDVTAPSIGLRGTSNAGSFGVSGFSSSNTGINGQSTSGIGVVGNSSGNVGVFGISTSSHGVSGSSTNGLGVQGFSTNNNGVKGDSTASIGVAGISQQNVGVYGVGSQSSGTAQGVFGFSSGGVGVAGQSATNAGVQGTSSSGNAVHGVLADGAAGFSGLFQGGQGVLIQGNFLATGTKSAVVPLSDGSTGRVYCLEAPESYFQDYGSGRVSNGRGRVSLDAEFASIVETNDYQVFIQPEGDSKGLYVSNKSRTGFDVQEQGGGTSNLAFSYVVVAKRRGVTAPRLARVNLPAKVVPQRPTPPPAHGRPPDPPGPGPDVPPPGRNR